MKYRDVGGRTDEITEERRNGKVTRHESRSNTANNSGRGSKREKREAGDLQGEAQNKMAIGIEANNNSSSTGWRRVAVRSVGVTRRLERAGEALVLERLAWFLGSGLMPVGRPGQASW